MCSNCGQDSGDDVFCGACGKNKTDSSQPALQGSSDLQPPRDKPNLPPPAEHRAIVDQRNTKRLQTVGSAAAGCGIGFLVVIAIAGIVVVLMVIAFLDQLGQMNSGMGSHAVAVSSYLGATTSRWCIGTDALV